MRHCGIAIGWQRDREDRELYVQATFRHTNDAGGAVEATLLYAEAGGFTSDPAKAKRFGPLQLAEALLFIADLEQLNPDIRSIDVRTLDDVSL